MIGNNFKWIIFFFNHGCINSFAQFWFYLYDHLSCQLRQKLNLGLIKEFKCDANVLTFFALALVSLETFNVLLTLHLLNINSMCSDSLLNFSHIQTLNFP
jgi:hypothetical protein